MKKREKDDKESLPPAGTMLNQPSIHMSLHLGCMQPKDVLFSTYVRSRVGQQTMFLLKGLSSGEKTMDDVPVTESNILNDHKIQNKTKLV